MAFGANPRYQFLMAYIPDPAILAAFTLACVIIIVTPGPDMTLFVSKTIAQGRLAGIVSYLGATTGLVVHTLLAAFGLSALLAASPAAFATVKVVGALYLLWLAVDAVRNGSALSPSRNGTQPQSLGEIYLAGLGINLLNPKIVLFFVTFLPQFISPNDPAAVSKLMFLGSYFILLAVPICLAIIVGADRISEAVRRSPRITRILDWIFGCVFAAFAVRLLLEPARN